MTRLAIIFLSIILIATATNETSTHQDLGATYEQAKRDLTRKVSCWEVDNHNNFVVSPPIYDLCRYDQVWPSPTTTLVNGITGGQDILRRFEAVDRAVLVICEYNALPKTDDDPSIMTLSCYCKRSGCNIVAPIGTLLHMNSKALHEIVHTKH